MMSGARGKLAQLILRLQRLSDKSHIKVRQAMPHNFQLHGYIEMELNGALQSLTWAKIAHKNGPLKCNWSVFPEFQSI
jgi:hypothetical protein